MALITDLPASTSVASTDVFVKDTGSTTQKITAPNLATQLASLQTYSRVTLTRTENPYVNAADFARLFILRCGKMGVFYCNLRLSTSVGNTSDFLEIGTIDATPTYNILQGIPAQNGSGTLTMQVTTDGRVNIYHEGSSSISGFFRATIPIIFV